MSEISYEIVEEGIMDRIRNFFGGRGTAGDPSTTPTGGSTADLGAKIVNIPFKDGKYPLSGVEALKDPEVLKLIGFFSKELPHIDPKQIEKMISLDPTRGINFMLMQTGINNAATETLPSQQLGTLSKEVPLSLTKKQKSTKPDEGKPAEAPLNSIMQKKLGLPPRAVNMIVKNIAQTLKSRGIQVAENKINSIVRNFLTERLAYTKEDFDKLRDQLEKINKRIETEKDSSSRKFLERSKLDIEEKIKRMEADLGLQKSAAKRAKDKKRKDYSDRKKALEKQGAKYGAAGKIIYKYAARQAQKDPEFMKAFGDNPQQQNKIVRSVEKVLRRMLRRRGFTDQEVKNALKENLSINNLSETDASDLIKEINKFYPYAQEYLKFDRPVSLNLVSDPNNAKDTFGKTAYYNPNNDEITIFVDKRHPKDMIRSFSHELVHHAQNCRGEFDKDFVAGENYVETDDHLNLMEREAYEKGNMCLRHYESYLKKENKKMHLNEEALRKAIREAIKRVAENKAKTIEEEQITETTEEVTETTEEVTETTEEVTETTEEVTETTEDVTEDTTTEETEPVTEEEVSEETETVVEEETTTSIRESLNKEKGNLIFDRLVNKWCK